VRRQLGRFNFVRQLAPDAKSLTHFTGRFDPSEPNWLVVPSIAHAIISLCSTVNWQN
jgi:hypothetical protein